MLVAGGGLDATVAVIGAGTSGCATAIVLARAGISTMLVERTAETSLKVGESLPPQAQTLVKDLGLWDRFLKDRHMESYANRSAWGSSDIAERDFIFDPRGNGWQLDRRRFDRMLRAAAVEAGAAFLCPARVLRARPDLRGGWEMDARSGSDVLSLRCRVVVDATSRAASFARLTGARRRTYDRMVGVVGLLPCVDDGPETDSRLLVEAAEHGWWYSTLVPSGNLVLGYMTDADLVPALEARSPMGWWSLLASTVHTRARANKLSPPMVAPRVVPASSSCLTPVYGNSWVAVGDAAVSHDPLSSLGLCNALATGRAAGDAILASLAGQDDALTSYAQHVSRSYDQYLLERSSCYALERRWSDSPFWKRRHQNRRPPGERMKSTPRAVQDSRPLDPSRRRTA